MFTGLIQRRGRLDGLVREGGGWRIAVSHEPWPTPLERGESVSVSGACLTVCEAPSGDRFVADLLDETLRRTALGDRRRGAGLNLERALRLGDRLGGHLVLGHVDETGCVEAIEARGRDRALRVCCSPAAARLTVEKGSVAIDGVSLTVSALGDTWIEVDLIPETWSATTLGELQPGDRVNLEADVLGKHVARLLGVSLPGAGAASPPAAPALTEAALLAAGFGEHG